MINTGQERIKTKRNASALTIWMPAPRPTPLITWNPAHSAVDVPGWNREYKPLATAVSVAEKIAKGGTNPTLLTVLVVRKF